MKLLKLSSSNPNFKTINFKDGLNIVAGLQLTNAEKQTYNGVGKSFTLNLVHLILGSKIDKSKENEKKIYDFLSNYGRFCLEASHDGKTYTIEKNFAEPHFFINNEKVAQKQYPEELKSIFLGTKTDPNLSFRQVLNVFARRYGGTYYSDVVTQQGRPSNDFRQMYVNLSLLGINTDLVLEKASIKDKISQLEKAKEVIKDYSSLMKETNLKDLKDELAKLIKEKDQFVIAENYDKYKEEADRLTQEINILRNKEHETRNVIQRKLTSLKQVQHVDVDIEKVQRLYEEANFFFEDKVSVRLEEARKFHIDLMKNRIKRLESEVSIFQCELDELDKEKKDKESKRDSILKDLDSKGALEEYNSIGERIRTLDSEVRELEKYHKMLESFESDETEYNLQNARIMADSIKYLTESEDYTNSIEDKFRNLVKRFYKNHGGTFKVKKTTDAKYLFNIDVSIPRDGSQGVNEVKIFCYDFLMYQLNRDLLNFIAHDGCIFSEMDPRQKSMIFKVALEHIKEYNLQYFVNIGQSSLYEVLDQENKMSILTEEEKQEIKNSIILKLYDKEPSKWLFGSNFG